MSFDTDADANSNGGSSASGSFSPSPSGSSSNPSRPDNPVKVGFIGLGNMGEPMAKYGGPICQDSFF